MRPVPSYAALTAALVVVLLVGACAGSADVGDAASSAAQGASDEPEPAAPEQPDPTSPGKGPGGDVARGEVGVDEFCDTYVGVIADLSTLSGDADDQTAAGVAVLKDWIAQMSELGTPAAMPAEAAAGFDVLAGLVDDLDDGASLDDLQGADSALSAQDEHEGTQFTDWITTHCPMAGGLAGSVG